MAYVFTEHSPSTTTYIRSGRGGAGNTFRSTNTTTTAYTTTSTSTSTSTAIPATAGASSTTTSTRLPSRRFFSGIGGAGNVHEADPTQARSPALLRSLELETHDPTASMTVGYAGRGGAGNVYRASNGRAGSDAGSLGSAKSWASDGSALSSKARAWATRVISNF